jgi:hypothetical protein
MSDNPTTQSGRKFFDPTSMRFILGAIAMAVIPLGTYLVRQSMASHTVEYPNRDFHSLPLTLSQWQGKDQELDPKIFLATGAKVSVDRIYTDNMRHVMSIQLAMYGDPDEGLYHRPYNCYKSHGFNIVSESEMPVQAAGREDMKIKLYEWEQKGQKKYVAYWYELGEHIIFERPDLVGARLALRGQSIWPPMIKVMIETPETNDPEEDKKRLSEFAGQICQWLDEPVAASAAEPGKTAAEITN